MQKPTKEELFERWGFLPTFVARDWQVFSGEVQEYTQEGYVGLLEAWDKCNWEALEHERQFTAYARKVIKSALRDMSASIDFATSGSGRSLNRRSFHSRASLDAVLPNTRVTEFSGFDSDDSSEDFDAILSYFHVLTDRQREVMGLYYLDGLLSDTRVADVLGVTVKAAQKVRVAAEERLKVHIQASAGL